MSDMSKEVVALKEGLKKCYPILADNSTLSKRHRFFNLLNFKSFLKY